MMDATVSFGVVSSAMIPVVSAHVGGEFRLFDVGFVDHGLAAENVGQSPRNTADQVPFSHCVG